MRLNNFKIKSLPLNKKFSDGLGLNLTLKTRNYGKWTYRYTFDGIAKEMAIGSYPEVSIVDARNLALEKRTLKTNGIDPIEEKHTFKKQEQEKAKRRFSNVAINYIDDVKNTWKNPKHAQQWHNTLRDYAFPILDEVPFHKITSEHVRRVLKPIWNTKSETAFRVQQRISRVMGYGISLGYYIGSNVADWKTSISFIFKRPYRFHNNFPSLHYKKLPDFYAELSKIESTTTRALRFLILTVARTSEVTLLQSDKLDFKQNIWTIPDTRMKAKKEHKVPLSYEAIKLLGIPHNLHNYKYVFTGSSPDSHLSNNAMGKFVRDHYRHMKFTVHGFRSTFRVWAAETGNYDQNMVEFALAHQLPTRSQAAYFRSDLFDKRKVLMEDWADFVTSKI